MGEFAVNDMLTANTYKPYRNPGFMDGESGPPAIDFKTTQDLLELEDVRQTHRFDTEYVISDGWLMAINQKGFQWWVLGKIKDPSSVDLPKWRGPKIKVQFNDGHEEVIWDGGVAVICGDAITLKDGREGRRVEPKKGLDF